MAVILLTVDSVPRSSSSLSAPRSSPSTIKDINEYEHSVLRTPYIFRPYQTYVVVTNLVVFVIKKIETGRGEIARPPLSLSPLLPLSSPSVKSAASLLAGASHLQGSRREDCLGTHHTSQVACRVWACWRALRLKDDRSQRKSQKALRCNQPRALEGRVRPRQSSVPICAILVPSQIQHEHLSSLLQSSSHISMYVRSTPYSRHTRTVQGVRVDGGGLHGGDPGTCSSPRTHPKHQAK